MSKDNGSLSYVNLMVNSLPYKLNYDVLGVIRGYLIYLEPNKTCIAFKKDYNFSIFMFNNSNYDNFFGYLLYKERKFNLLGNKYSYNYGYNYYIGDIKSSKSESEIYQDDNSLSESDF